MHGTELMPVEEERVFARLGGVETRLDNIVQKIDHVERSTNAEHRKVHDIVVAVSESIRIVARDVAEMKPHVEAYKLKAEKIDEAVERAEEHEEERIERRGADKFKNWLYGMWAGFGALVIFLLGKAWDAFNARPHPVVIALLLAMSTQAGAHSWYPMSCCHDQDCKPVPCEQIVETPQGFVFDGVTFSRSAEKPSQDRHCHVCIFDNGSIRHGMCLFTLQGT